MSVNVKIHKIYRIIVAVCDSNLIGKKFEQDNLELDVNEKFYKGEELDEEKILELLEDYEKEDACFNFVGKESINIGTKAGLIDPECVISINEIPHALALV
jgi:hypothetical protein